MIVRTGIPVRGRAEHLGGTRVRFIWPCGHTGVKDFSKGPVAKRIGQLGVQSLTSWWAKGGVTLPPCGRCKTAP